MAKRGNGEGSICQRKSDGKWMGMVTLRDGKRKYFYGKTRQEVARKVAESVRDREKGVPQRTDERMTVHAFFNQWLDGKKSEIVPTTWTRYRELLAHVSRAMGDQQLTRLNATMFQRLYARLQSEDGLSSSTVHHVHTVAQEALNAAVQYGLMAVNPLTAIKGPRMNETEMQPLDPEQTRMFLDTVHGDHWEAFYVLAISSGMREGEMLGLHWSDVDLERRFLQVRYTMSYVSGEGFSLRQPKTKRSRRRIDLSPHVVEVLREHRIRQKEHRLKMGGHWDEASFPDLVFPNEVGRPMSAGNLLRRSFLPLLDKAGLPRIRIHDLRHTAATLMLLEGRNAKEVSDRLGHASVTITLDRYSHVLPSMRQDMATALDRIMFSRDVHTATDTATATATHAERRGW